MAQLPHCEIVNTDRTFLWRMVLNDEQSEWTSHYQGILVHTFKDGRTFGVVTDYYCGVPERDRFKEMIPFQIVFNEETPKPVELVG